MRGDRAADRRAQMGADAEPQAFPRQHRQRPAVHPRDVEVIGRRGRIGNPNRDVARGELLLQAGKRGGAHMAHDPAGLVFHRGGDLRLVAAEEIRQHRHQPSGSTGMARADRDVEQPRGGARLLGRSHAELKAVAEPVGAAGVGADIAGSRRHPDEPLAAAGLEPRPDLHRRTRCAGRVLGCAAAAGTAPVILCHILPADRRSASSPGLRPSGSLAARSDARLAPAPPECHVSNTAWIADSGKSIPPKNTYFRRRICEPPALRRSPRGN